MTILLAECTGGRVGEGTENFSEIVVIGDADGLGHSGNGLVAFHQLQLGGTHPALGDHLGEGLAAGQALGQRAQLGAADTQLGGDRGQRELFHVVPVQIDLHPLKVGVFRGLDHAGQMNIGGQSL